jgi:hypothetical protein
MQAWQRADTVLVLDRTADSRATHGVLQTPKQL